MNPIESMTDSTKNQPAVYLVNPDGQHPGQINLPKLLAPIWRWKWIEILIVIFSITAASWYVTRPASLRRAFVIESGHFESQDVSNHLLSSIIPKISEQFGGYGFDTSINLDASDAVNRNDSDEPLGRLDQTDQFDQFDQFEFNVLMPNGDLQTGILDVLDSNINAYFKDLQKRANLQSSAEVSKLQLNVERAKSELQKVPQPEREKEMLDLLRQQYSAIEIQIKALNYKLDTIKDAGKDDATTEMFLASTALFDRLSSQRSLLLEQQNSLLDEISLLEANIRLSTSEIIYLSGQVEAAKSELNVLNAQIERGLRFHAPQIVAEYDLTLKDKTRRWKGLGIIIAGFFFAILTAYVLEAVRLARIGAMQS